MVTSIFEAKNLTKQYGTSFALEGVNMTIHSGEIYGLIGENGAGKTTLMKIIGDLARPSNGHITLFGEKEASKIKELRKKIGYLIEMPALYPELNARDNLEFYRRMFNIDDKNIISKVLREVSLEDTGDKKVENFSLGMRQRLGLAIAMINDPMFLVLDEPNNGLDPSGIAQVRDILKKLAKEKGVAILISSHVLSELQLLANKFGFIHKGRMLKEISSQELVESDEKNLCIKTSNATIASEVLKNAFNMEAIRDDESGEIRVSKGEITLEEIISVLIKNNLQILNVSITSQSLENYYMNLIRGEKE